MNVAILSESPADDAALRILVASLLEIDVNELGQLRFGGGGWSIVEGTLAPVIKHVHYGPDASHLVVLADSDDSPPHRKEHHTNEAASEGCRVCLLHRLASRTVANLRAMPGKARIKVAIAVAMPAIEAWYRCGRASAISEQVFADELRKKGQVRFRRLKLKKEVYGAERPSLALETVKATEEAQRLAKDLTQLERLFPGGFGTFADEVRCWREP